MKISDLFNRSSVYNSQRSAEAQRSAQDEALKTTAHKKSEDGEDRVSISPLARRFRQVSQILSEDEQSTQSRVAAIKSQVESGQYKVESATVAKSMLSFLKENEV